ncbi:MAG TPA: 3-phosphoshikimate 1-carboxyvinyltransferase [Candidatus Margulisiibacteriota bacterium]|nr:3-phosphoshikimate 1-carboxyvinyltransferase [Candidatus Margulisiibacteriota bacterium]
MSSFAVRRQAGLLGRLSFPGDKSIAHRAIILGALSRGKVRIENFPDNKDCLWTIASFRKLGIKIKVSKGGVVGVSGKGLRGLSRPASAIFTGESGTTLRLLLGVLAGQNFKSRVYSASSLARRPMLRVIAPLRMMGAKISSRAGEHPPFAITGGALRPIDYHMPVPSAQVKSAILLAGLFCAGKTRVREKVGTRDHTERMLKLFKADIKLKGNTIVIKGGKELSSPKKVVIPGDISSAAFFMVLAAITPGSRFILRNVSLNPSRSGIIKVLRRMGAKIKISSYKVKAEGSEPAGEIVVESSSLKGTRIPNKDIPSLIDEIPILMVAATRAKGRTLFEGVGELRFKETDRIRSMTVNLRKMGAVISISKAKGLESLSVEGVKELRGAKVRSFGDHRTAMSMIVAGMAATNKTILDDISCISKSFPSFLVSLGRLKKAKSH